MGVRNGGGGTIIIFIAVIDVCTIIIVGSIRNRGCATTSARLISCEVGYSIEVAIWLL